MKKFIVPVVLTLLAAMTFSCSDRNARAALDEVSSYISDNPEKALQVLDSLKGTHIKGRSDKARFALLYSMALDKNYIDIASDSIITCAVKYYSRFGSAEEKLLAHYYHGVTYMNAAEIDKAMDCFVRAGRYAGRCEDAGAVARLYTAKMLVYKYCYEFEKALSQEKLAAEYFLADGDSTRYFNALCSISTLGGLTGDSVAVFTSINLLNHHWEKLDDIQKSRCFITQIEASDDPAEKHRLIDENLSEVRDSSAIQWTGIANALLETGQFDAGLDAIDSYFENETGKYNFIDTAGMRKKSKVDDAIEKYSVLRATMAIERSDVCLILIDANDGVTEQDTKIAGLAHEAGKACIIVVNKWDMVEKDGKTMDRMREDIRRDLSYMTYAPILFISALTGQRVTRLFELINYVNNQASTRITTGMLNSVLADAQTRVQPPTDKGRRLKIYYMTQVGIKPPHFVIFCNDKKLFHFSYQRYLENQIRSVFGLEGTPIILSIRQKGDDDN